jgi:hypothetical protein
LILHPVLPGGPALEQPEAIQEILSRDKIGEGHVRYLSRIKDPEARVELAKRAAEEGWSVKMTEERVAKALGAPKPSRKSDAKAAKKGAAYEYEYNRFHCALFGDEVEIGGRRYKMNEELVDQYIADYRSALQCFVRDVRDRSTAQRGPESSGEPASSILPSPAETLQGLAEVEAAGQSLKDLLSQLGNNPAPSGAETTGEDATPSKPLE